MRKLPKVFTHEQINKLIAVIDEPWLMVAVLIALFCGLRRHEVTNITVHCLDLQGRRLRIENSKNPNRSWEGYGKDRVVPLPECVIPILEKWLAVRDKKGTYIFPSLKNPELPISDEHLFRAYKKALERASINQVIKIDSKGLPRYQFNFHTLRHTYATLLWEKTGDILIVKHALGHTKLETTMIYTHVTNKVVEQKINNAFIPENKASNTPDMSRHDPVGILMRRLALGEINTKTFKELRDRIRQEQITSNGYIG